MFTIKHLNVLKGWFDSKNANLYESLSVKRRPVQTKNRFLTRKSSKTGLKIILPSESEFLDQRTVSAYVFFLDIVQQASAPADQNQKAPS